MYIRGANPVWSFVDLTGHQLDDSYWMFVLENTIPYIPATVYHEPDGTAWTQPINFLANGTLPVDIYWDPGSDAEPNVYRIEIREGPTQSDPLIYLIENYIPGASGSSPLGDVRFTTDNQITNPQFAVVNFDSEYSQTIVSSSTDIDVGPGWVLSLTATGTASVVLTQVPLNSSDLTKNPSNAPYALRLQLSGFSDVKLKQRFEQNGMLWANMNVSSTITARSDDAGALLSARIVDSMGIPLGDVLDSTPVGGLFEEYKGHDSFGDTTNTDLPPDAYIEYQLLLQNNVDIYITSIQLIASPQDFPIEPAFEQDSIERQIDHTFHYWQPFLNYKPISSYLIGWDFPLNPSQWGTNIGPITIGSANKAFYAWDQTIVFQTVDNSVQVTSSGTPGGYLVLQPTKATQMAIVQYIDGDDAIELLLGGAASNYLCSQFYGTAGNSDITITITLWWSTTAPPNMTIVNGIPQGSVFFTGLDSDGRPTGVSGSWNEISNQFGQVTFTCEGIGSLQNFGFDGFNPGGAFLTGKYVAIVVGTGSVNTPNALSIKSVSLTPGSIPTVPSYLSSDIVLRQCQYYYESSYLPSVAPGTPATPSIYFSPLTVIGTGTFSLGFGNQFLQSKRNDLATAGQLTIYSPSSGASDNVFYNNTSNTTNSDLTVSTNFTNTAGVINRNGFSYLTTNTTALYSGAPVRPAYFTWHYVADARIGVF